MCAVHCKTHECQIQEVIVRERGVLISNTGGEQRLWQNRNRRCSEIGDKLTDSTSAPRAYSPERTCLALPPPWGTQYPFGSGGSSATSRHGRTLCQPVLAVPAWASSRPGTAFPLLLLVTLDVVRISPTIKISVDPGGVEVPREWEHGVHRNLIRTNL